MVNTGRRAMRRVMWRIRVRTAQGVVALVPIVVTVLILRFAFNFTAGILLPFIDPALEAWPWISRAALSLAALVVGVYVLGEITSQVVGRRLIGLGEAVLLRVPIVKVIYRASKQVVAAFQGPGKQAFKSVVFLEFPRQGMRSVGFLTGRIERSDGSTWVTVFVPTTPNPTTGFLQILPEADVVQTDYTVEEGVKMIMSLGALVPERETAFP